MLVKRILGLLSRPVKEWETIIDEKETVQHLYTHHLLILALIPVVCSLIGTTLFGWRFGEHSIQLSFRTAIIIAVIFYLLILLAVFIVGKTIHWMANRYGKRPSLKRCIIFAGYTATPMLLIGLIALYPIVWLCLLIGIIGLCYSAYLLYTGIPVFLKIDKSEGLIFSSSVLAIGILVLEFLLAIAVVLWGYGERLF